MLKLDDAQEEGIVEYGTKLGGGILQKFADFQIGCFRVYFLSTGKNQATRSKGNQGPEEVTAFTLSCHQMKSCSKANHESKKTSSLLQNR